MSLRFLHLLLILGVRMCSLEPNLILVNSMVILERTVTFIFVSSVVLEPLLITIVRAMI